MNLKIEHFKEIGSTSDYALNLVSSTALRSDYAILADIQTAGRGRLGNRIWVSVDGNFHCTYIVNIRDLSISKSQVVSLNFSVVNAMRQFLCDIIGTDGIDIKLPNDILIKGRKIAGALTEVSYPYAAIGIGMNLTKSPIENSTDILSESKISIKPMDIVENLYRLLLRNINLLKTSNNNDDSDK
ncbi:MAG: biotin--[acetyl-CoA-carboxylase] ligase [Holosporales bacterium]|jgi:BirA family biotin operon repressor/biotin-[acetyl-CoA-carboxylase] ligase|nr:biotin--[acetyl-CoA-carboxylase] ligase [Holosporales bacterium]